MNKKYESLETTHPNLIKEIDLDKNKNLDISQLTIGSHKEIYWKCENGHSWKTQVYHRKNNGCPYCSGKKIIPYVNDVMTLYPNLLKEWDFHKNEENPHTLAPKSKNKYYWICTNNHSFIQSMDKRTIGRNCPICSNQLIVEGINDLKTINPDLAKEWNYSKNGDLLPTQVAPSSKKEVWWTCKLGHEWKTSINKRQSHHTNCPYCCNKKILIGYNDLTTTHPELISSWSSKNKIKPMEVTFGSKKDIIWKCNKCNNEWITKVHVRKDFGCPRCRESKGEKRITNYLNKKNISYQSQYRIPTCKNKKVLPFDFAIFDNQKLICLIEYDGIQHFQSIEAFNGEIGFEKTKENDNIKTNYCKENHIKLIRISYKDYDNIEKILENYII